MVLPFILGLVLATGQPRVEPATAPRAEPPRFALQFSAGSQLNAGGDNLSGSFAYSLTPRLSVLAEAERLHIPTDVTLHESEYGATRGGTQRFVSGQVRLTLLPDRGVSPYVFGGMGFGTSRPNVNELFPDPVTNDLRVVFAGGGIRVRVGARFTVLGDARFTLAAENDDVSLWVPVRVGLAWLF